MWRPANGVRAAGEVELAIVHRPRYDDWSWPKGGVESGEHPLQTAAREVREETGYDVVLGPALTRSSHERPGGRTTVHLWAARLAAGGTETAIPNPAEVDQVRWVTVGEAQRLLSYDSDQVALTTFLARPRVTTMVLLIRHASAGTRAGWSGPDEQRPLDPTGSGQADRLAAVLPVFHPRTFRSADLVRCVQTIAPLATGAGAKVATDVGLADATWERRPTQIAKTVTAAALKAQSRSSGAGAGAVVLCAQGGAIPTAVESLVARTSNGLTLPSEATTRAGLPRSRKGSVWVLGFAGSDLVTASYLPDLAPAT